MFFAIPSKKNSYNYLQKVVPVLCPSTCIYFICSLKNRIHDMIQNRNCIISILEMVYNGYVEFRDHIPVEPIPVVLCGDAASLKSSIDSSCQSVYVFHLLPLDGNLPPAVIHIIPRKSGPSTPNIVNAFEEIAKYLHKIGFIQNTKK